MPPEPGATPGDAFRLAPRAGALGGILLRLLERLTGLTELQRRHAALPVAAGAASFLDLALAALGIRARVEHAAGGPIPARGALLVVANHPFGAADGMVLLRHLLGVRDDVRVLANRHLGRIAELRGHLLQVDPITPAAARTANGRALRAACRWLKGGGVLVVFPAGEVSHLRLRQRAISDPPWDPLPGRLLLATAADALPVYFHGRNSLLFCWAGLLHPRLRTLLLARELLRLRGRDVRCVIGRPIGSRTLTRLGTASAVTDYLRLRTGLLASWCAQVHGGAACSGVPVPVQAPVPAALLAAEVDHLPADRVLCSLGELRACVARAHEAPWVMQELGRLREISFREAGEGTGRATDLDLFDSFYHHVFLWNARTGEIVGAYRLGIVADIVRHYGRRGLYTQTLFRYGPDFLRHLHPAVELGRSFIRAEYQRSYAALNLLWRGIGQFVIRHDVPVLFGPVSISRDYSLASRRLLVECLRRSAFEGTLARRVRPRRPFRPGSDPVVNGAGMLLRDVDIVSELVAACEPDAKGIPILFRQYLRLGGRFIGFNVDADFSDVVDGLIVVDLRRTDPRVLARYLGTGGAERFHGATLSRRAAGAAGSAPASAL